MATLIMKKDGDKGGVFNDGDIVSGGAGEQTLLLFTDGTLGHAKNIVVDTTIERVDVQAKAADMKLTYNADTGRIDIVVGTTRVASVQPQQDTEGTQIATADGSFFLKSVLVSGALVHTISNGLPGSTPTSFTSDYVPQPADIDASQKSEIGGGGDTLIHPTPGVDQTFILTEGADLSGVNLKSIAGSLDTSGDDLFIGTLGGSGKTLNAGDAIDGGAGTNKMQLVLDGVSDAQTLPGVSIKNMQSIDVVGAISGSGGITLDTAAITGLKTITIDSVVNSGSGAIILKNMADASTIGLKGALSGYNLAAGAD